MFWIHLEEEDYWQLVVASPMVTEQGSLTAYRRIGEFLRQFEFAGLALHDIAALGPESQEFQ